MYSQKVNGTTEWNRTEPLHGIEQSHCIEWNGTTTLNGMVTARTGKNGLPHALPCDLAMCSTIRGEGSLKDKPADLIFL